MSPYQNADTWFRDMREPGFNGEVAPSGDNSLHWLAQELVADERFATGAVRSWWPAIMGVHLTEPPEDSSDPDFEALRLAAGAQALEVEALSEAFREGIEGGEPYNGKDLLAEIALSPWSRAESVTGNDQIRARALREAGVARPLTPEELASKTDAIAGYVWGRRIHLAFGFVEPRSKLNPNGSPSGYGLLYGGIDSYGITERTGELTPLMAAVAQSHAAEVSCPIVYREFFYWPDGNRLLFDGISKFDTPYSEAAGDFDVAAETWETRQTVASEAPLTAGSKTARLTYSNNRVDASEADDAEPGDRNLILDSLVVRDSDGATVHAIELESLDRQNCGRPREQFYKMITDRSVEIAVNIASDGVYSFDVVAHQDRAGNERARLEIAIETEDGSSQGALAIRGKLAELHQRLFGVTVSADSPDVEEAFNLFVEAWNRKRTTEGSQFAASRFRCNTTDDHLYFEGVVDNVLEFSALRSSRLESDLVTEFNRGLDRSDPSHAVRTWVVTLAYLLTDYRYLYF